ncbi:FAD dependent oxidoreductase-domain-containing protein [Talaromyces proteolyticus]|uniref:FAD dependent oxidoreductase-domain-containing protein n=1 Tax=Talaromyces proteolyticus TaxID=1131652 RepID=A0AAD4L3H3_9EURO|nr:FAD dependent oxidoreductase-domain-containing protein [Talaromyces proteolyticus]KAH8705906.1 FAD dependent oxidoreductase-domain-containing protein [Talaromyces proteolyticus]
MHIFDKVEFSSVKPFDIIIVGGGAAGIGAAIGARQAAPDARILLVESESCLGGAATHRGVCAYCGLFTVDENPRQAVGSIWLELKERLRAVNGTTESPVRIRGVFQVVEPEPLKLVLDDLMNDYNIDVLLHTTVVGATRSASNMITSVDLQERRGRLHVSAKAFVDCSGDCDLAYLAGASTRFGNHGTLNLGSLSARFGGIDPNTRPSVATWRDAIISAKKKRPELCDIIPKNGSALLHMPISGDVITFLPSASYDPRSSASITAAERSGRRQAQEYLQILRALPGHEGMYLVSTGPNFGTRESRHMNSMHQLMAEDIMDDRRFSDVIALGAWGFEFHDVEHESWESTFTYPPKGRFDIPLGSLRSIDTPNLFAAGRCIDADQKASSAVRVMGTALATGQAAGVAAGFEARRESSGGWDVSQVQDCLRAHGALLDSDLLPDVGPIEQIY